MEILVLGKRPWLRVALGVLAVVLLISIVLSITGTILWPEWTGIEQERGPTDTTQVSVVQLHRTLWDWMQLLLVPLAVAGAAGWLNLVQQQRTEATEAKREQDSVLDTYLDQMSNLLLHEKLLNPPVDYRLRFSELIRRVVFFDRNTTSGAVKHIHENVTEKVKPNEKNVRHVARVKTLTALRRLDGVRKGVVLRFLAESELIPVVALYDADLCGVNLSSASLTDADLVGADLRDANLPQADLHGADLQGANLENANLAGANLIEANLKFALMRSIDLTKADLVNADLTKADLQGANLENANLRSAILVDANLQGAKLDNATLIGADLTGAHLPAR
jgi:hypothetical protein